MAKVGALRLLGHNWSIVTDKELPQDLDGLAILTEKKIILADGMTKKEFRHAYLHELLHAALFEASFGAMGLPIEAEELLVDLLAKQIAENFDVIKKHLG